MDGISLSANTAAYSETPAPLGRPGGPGLWFKGWKLPDYIEQVATGILKGGEPDKSRAIALAIGAVKRWAAGGGKVSPEVRAAAAKAVAEWTALKAAASSTPSHSHANEDGAMIELVGPGGYVHGWIKAGPAGIANDHKTADQMSKAELKDHLESEHSGGVPTGRRIGTKNPSVAQLRAQHEMMHKAMENGGHGSGGSLVAMGSAHTHGMGNIPKPASPGGFANDGAAMSLTWNGVEGIELGAPVAERVPPGRREGGQFTPAVPLLGRYDTPGQAARAINAMERPQRAAVRATALPPPGFGWQAGDRLTAAELAQRLAARAEVPGIARCPAVWQARLVKVQSD